jgi:hypothetical protein
LTTLSTAAVRIGAGQVPGIDAMATIPGENTYDGAIPN